MNLAVEKEEKTTLLESKAKIDKAYLNYNKIIDKQLPQKFDYLDDWQFKYSKLLLDEAEELEDSILDKKNNHTIFKKYKRGTIIKIDFGVGLGSEMSQVHYAIVLNKYDNPHNKILTVIPLTSKKSKFNLDLDNLIYDSFSNTLMGLLDECCDKDGKVINPVKYEKLYTLIKVYKNSFFKHTYACCSLITTISKTRIKNPVNEYDIIGKQICPNEVLDKIDAEIIDRFTH